MSEKINRWYTLATTSHKIEPSDEARKMFCAGVATGMGFAVELNSTIEDPINLRLALNTLVVDAMEFATGPTKEVADMRAHIAQIDAQLRQNEGPA